MSESKGNYISGAWKQASAETFTSLNPATGAVIWRGKAANAADVNAAVKAAHAAFPAWSRKSVEERLSIIDAFKKLLESRIDTLARTIAEETGKTLWDAKGEVQAMIGKVAISLNAYNTRTGAHETEQPGNIKLVLRHRPHGVLAVFGPYNFPGHLPNGHIVPALIAGNTLVFKPSEQTPRVAEETIALWHEAGLPAGVLNLVQGARDTGVALAGHESVDGILFTGSAEVGAMLHKQFGGRPEKLLALEMGGNNPLIMHAVQDKKAAALIAVQSAYLSSGQRCTCARRLIVPHGAEGDAIIADIAALIPKLRVGAYDDTPEPFMGPLISNREAERLLAAQDALIAQGAKAVVAMKRLRENLPFLSPGLLDVTAVKNREDREYFGPLLQIIRVKDVDAAIAEANNTRFGLAAGLVSDDASLYARFISEIRAGVVNWNRPTNGASSALPFGGVGVSGNHRPSAYYAADYCAYPMASMEAPTVAMPDKPLPGINQ